LSDRYKDQLKIVIKHYPIPNHEFARKAAQASLAAHKQGKFWEFHKKLFENHDSLDNDKIDQIARELALDIDKFKTDLNLPEIQSIIDRDIQNGKKIGIRGTPTIFINGKQINPRTSDDFIKTIEAELKKPK
jgi:protein-disulfide isomerase